MFFFHQKSPKCALGGGVLEETYSKSPCSNLNAVSDEIFIEKQESSGNCRNCQIQPPRGRSKKNATQFLLWWQRLQLLLAPVKGRGDRCSDHHCQVSAATTTISAASA
jgi:hypothetical protein